MTSAQRTEALLRVLDGIDNETARPNLHIHTTVSDGSHTFAQVLDKAQCLGLTHIAFTNHDTTAYLDQAIRLGERFKVEVIGGIEISAWDAKRARKAHVLGYGLTSQSPAIEALCASVRARRNQLSIWALERLQEAGYEVNAGMAYALASDSGVMYKQHIMAALTTEAFKSNAYQTLYKSLFKGDGLCAGDIEYVDVHDAVRAVVADGGVAVLAHPGQMGNYELVPELIHDGLRGIEKFHPDHTPEDYALCDKLAKRYGLVRTKGSDYHGRFGRFEL